MLSVEFHIIRKLPCIRQNNWPVINYDHLANFYFMIIYIICLFLFKEKRFFFSIFFQQMKAFLSSRSSNKFDFIHVFNLIRKIKFTSLLRMCN